MCILVISYRYFNNLKKERNQFNFYSIHILPKQLLHRLNRTRKTSAIGTLQKNLSIAFVLEANVKLTIHR